MADFKSLILIVDDDPFVRALLSEILEDKGYAVLEADSGRSALEVYHKHQNLDLIISDMNMDEMDGLEFIKEFRKLSTEIPVIILTVNTEITVALEAIRSGASDYILKDENIQETVILALDKTLEKQELKKQNMQLIQDLAKKNEELEKSNKELVELNILKNRFLGIAAHDLRSPIGGIKGIIEILMRQMEGESTEKHLRKLELVHNTTKEMLALLNDLLDISIIESGKLDLEIETASLNHIIGDRIRIHWILADKKQISLSVNFSETPEIACDIKRIAQVFDNLMSNAVKFSPKRTTIEIHLYHDDQMVYLKVKDEGPGISEEDQARVFDEFEKIGTPVTGNETSTGLGLAISKRIMEAHSGFLHLESKPGQGATFTFALPLRA